MENTENDAKFIEINPLSKEFFTREFQKKNFFFNADKPSLIGSAQCGKFQRVYIFVRALYITFYIYRLYFTILRSQHGKLLPYLGNIEDLSVLVILLAVILHFACSVHLLKKLDSDTTKTPTLYKITWLAVVVKYNAAWQATWQGAKDFCQPSEFEADIVTIINTVIFLVDIFISGYPIRLLHFYPSTLIGLIYVSILTIYWYATGVSFCRALMGYHLSLVFAIFTGLTVLSTCVAQVLLFLLYWLRLMLFRTCGWCSRSAGDAMHRVSYRNSQRYGVKDMEEEFEIQSSNTIEIEIGNYTITR